MKGIYCIRFQNNNEVINYIGSSINILKRLRDHKSNLKNNCHDNQFLQNIYNKHGIEFFNFLILEEINDSNDLLSLEKEYLIKYNVGDRTKSFNIATEPLSPFKGLSHTNETKIKLSEQTKKRWQNQEYRDNQISQRKKPVYAICNKEKISYYFISIQEAAEFLIDHNISQSNQVNSVRNGIWKAIAGRSKTYLNMEWQTRV